MNYAKLDRRELTGEIASLLLADALGSMASLCKEIAMRALGCGFEVALTP